MYKTMFHAVLIPGLLAWVLLSCEGTGIAMAMDERGAAGRARDGRLLRELRTLLDLSGRNAGRVDDSVVLRENEVVQGIYAQQSERRFWVDSEGLKVSGRELAGFIDSVLAYGLFPRHYPGREIAALRRSTGDSAKEGDEALWARKEVLLTDAFVRLARHLRIGRLPEDSISFRRDSLIEASNILALLHRSGPRDDEQLLPIDFDLGHLRGVERVFHRQRMQAELGADQFHLLRRRIGQPDPVETALVQRGAALPIDGQRIFGRLSTGIAARGNDRHCHGLPKRHDAGNPA